MTHEGIIKVNEFFNNKLFKNSTNVKTQLTYTGNFGNQAMFITIRRVVKALGYEDVKGQIDSLYCLIDAIKNKELTVDNCGLYMSADSKSYMPVKDLVSAITKTLNKGKISFDDRVRRDILVSIYLDSTHVNIKTSFLSLDKHKELYKELLQILISTGLFICKDVVVKIDSADFYLAIYENAKTVMKNMSSRGISMFAIACHFWMNNRDFISTPFLKNWSGFNFIQALLSTSAFTTGADEELKQVLPREKVYWTVFSELSLMTGRISNVHPKRKVLNQIINRALDAEGEVYIKDYLRRLKLVGNQNPIASIIISGVGNRRDVVKQVEKRIQEELRQHTTRIPEKELIVESIKYQFMISKILDVDFSSKRKDHLILDKGTRQRVFDIL